MGENELSPAALDAARRFCGWHVSPSRADTYTLRNDRAWESVILPTQKIVSIESIQEAGVAVDPAETTQYSGEPGIVYRKGRAWLPGDLTFAFTHGYAEDDPNVASWRAAVRALSNGERLSAVEATLRPFKIGL